MSRLSEAIIKASDGAQRRSVQRQFASVPPDATHLFPESAKDKGMIPFMDFFLWIAKVLIDLSQGYSRLPMAALV